MSTLMAAAVGVCVAVAPMWGQIDSATGSLTMGETDTYNSPVYPFCPLFTPSWKITAKLVSFVAGDEVLVETNSLHRFPYEAKFAVLNEAQSEAVLVIKAPTYCPPFISLTGVVVADEVSYELDSCRIDWDLNCPHP